MWVGQRGKRDLGEGEGNEWRDARNKIERRVKGDRDRERKRITFICMLQAHIQK